MLKLAKLLHSNHFFHITFVMTHYNHHRLLKSGALSPQLNVPDFNFESTPDSLPAPPEGFEDATQREPSIDNGTNQEESTMKPCFNRVDFLAKAIMAIIGIISGAALAGYKDIKLPLDSLTLTAAFFLLLTLVSGYGLWLYVNYMPNHISLTKWQYMLHILLVSCGGICLMCTNVLILALVNPVNVLVACFLVVVPLVIAMLAYAGSQINGTNFLHRDQAFEAAMKSCCDVAYLTGGAATSMHVAVVFMYYKNPSLRANQLPPIDISVTFLASILGFFSMMVTAMPLESLPLTVRSKLLFTLKLMKYSMLFLTTTATMTLGGKFLDGLILLALMPILVLIVAYQAMLLLTGQRVNPDPNNVDNEDLENPDRVDPDPNNVDNEDPENPDRVDPDPNNVDNEDPENPDQVDPDPNNVHREPEIPSMLTGVTNTCIVMLSAVYALYTGGENDDTYLRVGVFILVGIIASCLSWIGLILNPSMNEQWANVTKLVIGILLGLMITIAAAFLLKICVDLYDQSSF